MAEFNGCYIISALIFNEKTGLMDNILHELFARQAFTSSLVERNFGQVSGWIELVGVLMQMVKA